MVSKTYPSLVFKNILERYISQIIKVAVQEINAFHDFTMLCPECWHGNCHMTTRFIFKLLLLFTKLCKKEQGQEILVIVYINNYDFFLTQWHLCYSSNCPNYAYTTLSDFTWKKSFFCWWKTILRLNDGIPQKPYLIHSNIKLCNF